MFQTLTNVQRGGAVPLQQYIDNRSGTLRVGLRSITYTAGWHNIKEGESFSWRSPGEESQTYSPIPPGLYNTKQLCDMIMGSTQSLYINASKTDGLITLVVRPDTEALFTDGLLDLLGLDDGLGGQWLTAGAYKGDRPVDFAATKTLHVHLEQLNTSSNVLNGAPSTLLSVIGLGCHSFGEISTIRVEHPEYKSLQNGTVGELKIAVRDDTGKPIDNHDLPISVTLEVRRTSQP